MRTIPVIALCALAACSGSAPDQPEASLNLSLSPAGPTLFVASKVESQTTVPLTVVDMTCSGVRYQQVVYDTISLSSDGTARRAYTLQQLTNGVVDHNYHSTATGTWSRFVRRDTYYYSDSPSIMLSLVSDDSHVGGYTLPLRLLGSDALTNLAAMGGYCPESGNSGREREFTYTRQ